MVQLLTDADNTDVGGAEVQLAQFARLLRAQGWRLSVVTEAAGQEQDIRSPEGIRILASYRSTGGGSVLGWVTHKWPRLWRALGKADADIYLTRAGGWLTGAVSLFARLHGRRSAFWTASRMDPDNYTRSNGWPVHIWRLYRYGVRTSDLILTQSEEQRQSLKEVAGRDAHVVRNVWDIPAAAYPGDKSGVLWVANMRELKRPHMLLDVAERLPSIEFTMVGAKRPDAPELFEAVRARTRRLANVHFVGQVPFGEMPPYYAQAALVACTSTIEGFPNTFLQGWSSGTPVVSTVDPDGVIEQHHLGAHCDTVEAMSEAVRDILGNPEGYREMQQRCREYVKQYHSPEAVIPRLESLLINLVSGKEETT